MVFEVFCSHWPPYWPTVQCGQTPHHQQKSFILWKSLWPKEASQCSAHYLSLSTFEVWRNWVSDSVINRRKSLSCYPQLKISVTTREPYKSHTPVYIFVIPRFVQFLSIINQVLLKVLNPVRQNNKYLLKSLRSAFIEVFLQKIRHEE